jgi:hypothetical protein
MIRPLVSRDTFVPTKIVLKVGFLELDFERDHLAEKSYWTKMGQKIHCAYTSTFPILLLLYWSIFCSKAHFLDGLDVNLTDTGTFQIVFPIRY